MNDEAEHGRVVAKARELFFAEGFHGVTMDALAQALGMSKRTLYELIPGKDRLIEAVLAAQIARIEGELRAILDADLPFLEKKRRFFATIAGRMGEMRPRLFADLARFYPALHERIQEARRRLIPDFLGRLVRQGMAEGAVRTDVSPELFARAFLAAVLEVARPETFAELDLRPAEVPEQLGRIFFEGLRPQTDRPPTASP